MRCYSKIEFSHRILKVRKKRFNLFDHIDHNSKRDTLITILNEIWGTFIFEILKKKMGYLAK